MAQSLRSVINQLLEKNGLTAGVNQQKALLEWEAAVGTTIAKNTEPDRVEHGIIYVKTATPAWRQELIFKKKEIIVRLNKILGKQTIKDIRFI